MLIKQNNKENTHNFLVLYENTLHLCIHNSTTPKQADIKMAVTEASVILSFAQILLSANIDSLFLLSYYFRKFFESKCGLVEFIAMKTLQNGSVQVPIPNSTTGIAKEWSLFSLGGERRL